MTFVRPIRAFINVSAVEAITGVTVVTGTVVGCILVHAVGIHVTSMAVVSWIIEAEKGGDIQVATLVRICAVEPVTKKAIIAGALITANCIVTSCVGVTGVALVETLVDISAIKSIAVSHLCRNSCTLRTRLNRWHQHDKRENRRGISYSHKHCDVQVATLVGISAVKPITEKSIVAKTLVRADCVVTSSISVTSMAPIVALIDISAIEAVSIIAIIAGAVVVPYVGTGCISAALVDTELGICDVGYLGDVGVGTLIDISTGESIAEESIETGALVTSGNVGAVGLGVARVTEIGTLVNVVTTPLGIVPISSIVIEQITLVAQTLVSSIQVVASDSVLGTSGANSGIPVSTLINVTLRNITASVQFCVASEFSFGLYFLSSQFPVNKQHSKTRTLRQPDLFFKLSQQRKRTFSNTLT